MFELDKWNAEPGQSSRQGSLRHQASGIQRLQRLPAAEENGDQLGASPFCFSSRFWGRDGGMHKHQAKPKGAPTVNPKQQQEQAFPSSGIIPASPPSFFLHEKRQHS